MDRRTIIKQITILTGAAFVGGEIFIQTGCKSSLGGDSVSLFTSEQIALLDDIGETILPASDTPGAKAVNIGSFMNSMVTDCYNSEQQKIFGQGLKDIENKSQENFKLTFAKTSSEQREALLNKVNTEANKFNKEKKKDEPNHYFTMMKQLTILGYFSSEMGATQALNYISVPGKYDGSYPFKTGDKAWAT